MSGTARAATKKSSIAYLETLVTLVLGLAAAKVLGDLFPRLSLGMGPKITGYLVCGIILGPFCTNFLSEVRTSSIAKPLNQLSLGFIAGAAGMELFYPELRPHLNAMGFQVLFIVVMTLVFCGFGVLVLTELSLISVPSITSQSSMAARESLSFLAGSIMTARSPASAIAVIAELGCRDLWAARMALGITVLTDVVVLVLFTIMTHMVRVNTVGGNSGPGLCSVIINIVGSVLGGSIVGHVMRVLLPKQAVNSAEGPGNHDDAGRSSSVKKKAREEMEEGNSSRWESAWRRCLISAPGTKTLRHLLACSWSGSFGLRRTCRRT
jgi:Kef-type K+ transport system membrane component KefB